MFVDAQRVASRREKTAAQSSVKADDNQQTAIELYAVKSFQAQDMSGRFNRARMNQAIKEAKVEVKRGK